MDSVLSNRYPQNHDGIERFAAAAKQLQQLAHKTVRALQRHQRNRTMLRNAEIFRALSRYDHRLADDFARS
jgi:hypothetical protein